MEIWNIFSGALSFFVLGNSIYYRGKGNTEVPIR
jgi:hypothetical protein